MTMAQRARMARRTAQRGGMALLFWVTLAGLPGHTAEAAYTGRISVGTAGAQANADSFPIEVSPSGGLVAFWSNASNLPGGPGTFIRDRIAASTMRVGDFPGYGQTAATPDLRFFAYSTSAGVRVFDRNSSSDTLACAANNNFFPLNPAISDDGSVVAFESGDATLVPGDGNHAADVFACTGGSADG